MLPLLQAPLLDADGLLLDCENLLASASFSFAPSLLEILEREHPRLYARVLEADRRALGTHGRGTALAYPHPSLILPLASAPERRAAIDWGLSDFRRRFGRDSEGFCLPGGAVCEETLGALAERGLRFVLLDPSLLEKTRPVSGGPWTAVSPERFEPRRPYLWRKGSSSLALFFRDGRLSRAGEAGRLVLGEGRALARRLVDGFRVNDACETMLVALDAGHWAAPGGREGVLAETFATLAREPAFALAPVGKALDLFPPPEEACLRLPGAADCPHALARWSGVCPCPPALAPHTRRSTAWRAPLREALRGLGAATDSALEPPLTALFDDPGKARTHWFDAGPNPDAAAVQRFLDRHALRHLTPEEARRALRLLEAWRMRLEALSQWTWAEGPACGPALRALRCAARALLLLERESGDLGPREAFLDALRALPGKERTSAAESFASLLREQEDGFRRYAAHAAALDHLTGALGLPRAPAQEPVYAATFEPLRRARAEFRGKLLTLSVARMVLRDRRLREERRFLSCVSHTGGLSLETRLREGFAERDPEAALALEHAFLEGTGSDFATLASELLGPARSSLDALLGAERRRAVLELSPPTGLRAAALAHWRDALASQLAGGPPEGLLRAALHAAEAGLPADALADAAHARALVRRAAEDFAAGTGAAQALHGLLRLAAEARLSLPLAELRALALEGLRREPESPGMDDLRREFGISPGAKLRAPAGRAA